MWPYFANPEDPTTHPKAAGRRRQFGTSGPLPGRGAESQSLQSGGLSGGGRLGRRNVVRVQYQGHVESCSGRKQPSDRSRMTEESGSGDQRHVTARKAEAGRTQNSQRRGVALWRELFGSRS